MTVTVDFIGRRINDCDSNTNWAVYRLVGAGGGTWSSTANVDTEDFVQGSSSLNALGAANNNNNKPHAIMYDYNTASGAALNWAAGGNENNQLVWLWTKVSSPVSTSQNMVGLGICLSSAASSPVDTDSAIWNTYKAETYPGGWVRLLCDPSNTTPTASGASFALNSVNFIGVAGATTISRQTNLLWIDAVDIGSGIYVYGNSDSEDVINEISVISESGTNKWGALEALEETDTAYISRGVLHFGDYQSTNTTNITGTNSVVIIDQPTHTTSYTTLTSINSLEDNFPTIVCRGNTTASTNINLGVVVSGTDIDGDENFGRNGVTFIGNNLYNINFNFNDGNVDSLKMYGCTLRNFKPTGGLVWDAEANHELVGCFIDNCSRLKPDSGVFIRNTTFLNHTSVGLPENQAALYFTSNTPSDTIIDVKNSSFVANDYGIEHPATGTFAYDNLKFSANTYDVYFNYTGGAIAPDPEFELTINLTNGANPTTYISGANEGDTQLLSAVTLTLTNIKTNSEVRIRPTGNPNVVLFAEETVTDGTSEYTYNFPPTYSDVDIFVMNVSGYQWYSQTNFTLSAGSENLFISQIPERNYST